MFSDTVLNTLAITARESKLQSQQATLQTTILGQGWYSFSIPDWANAFRAYPSAAARFAINAAPLAISTATFVLGGVLDATTWTTKVLGEGTSRTLQVTTAATATTVIVEVY